MISRYTASVYIDIGTNANGPYLPHTICHTHYSSTKHNNLKNKTLSAFELYILSFFRIYFRTGVVTSGVYNYNIYNICLGRCDRDWSIIDCVAAAAAGYHILICSGKSARMNALYLLFYFLPLRYSLHCIYLRPRIKRSYNI